MSRIAWDTLYPQIPPRAQCLTIQEGMPNSQLLLKEWRVWTTLIATLFLLFGTWVITPLTLEVHGFWQLWAPWDLREIKKGAQNRHGRTHPLPPSSVPSKQTKMPTSLFLQGRDISIHLPRYCPRIGLPKRLHMGSPGTVKYSTSRSLNGHVGNSLTFPTNPTLLLYPESPPIFGLSSCTYPGSFYNS
jgi:hypothetical protein